MKRICKQCGKEFVLTQDEIAFYQSKNLHIPKRCEACRRENRASGKTGKQMQPVAQDDRQVVRAYHGGENGRKKSWAVIAAVLILLAAVIIGSRMGLFSDQNGSATQDQEVQSLTSSMPDIADAEDSKSASDIAETKKRQESPDIAAAEEMSAEKPAAAELSTDEPAVESAAAELSTSEPETVPAPAVTYTYNFRKAEYLQEHFAKHGAEFGYASAEEYLAGANRVIASADVLHKLEAEDGDDVYYLEATNEFVIVSTDGFLRTYFKPEDGKAYFDRQ